MDKQVYEGRTTLVAAQQSGTQFKIGALQLFFEKNSN
jgi:hypothetical protein